MIIYPSHSGSGGNVTDDALSLKDSTMPPDAVQGVRGVRMKRARQPALQSGALMVFANAYVRNILIIHCRCMQGSPVTANG